MIFLRYLKKYRGKALAVIIAVAIFSTSYITLFSTVETFVGSVGYQVAEDLREAQLIVYGNFTIDDVEEIKSRPEVESLDVAEEATVLVYKPTGGFRFANVMFYLPDGIYGSQYNISDTSDVAISDFFARHFEIGDKMNVSIYNRRNNTMVNGTFTVTSTFKAKRSVIRPRFDLVISVYYYVKHVSPFINAIIIKATNKDVVKDRLSHMSNVYTIQDVEKEIQESTKEARESMAGLQFINVFLGLLGGVLIAGTFYIVVDERRKHIAVLRAMGASGRDIMKEFMLEAAILGILGRALGALLSIPLVYFGTSLLLSLVKLLGVHIAIKKVVISAPDIYRSFIYSIVLVFLGLLPPLVYALKVRPIEAMRPPIITISGFPVKSFVFALILSALALYSYASSKTLSRNSYYFAIIALTLLTIVLLRAGDQLIGKIASFFGPSTYVGSRLANIHVKRTVMIGVLIGITIGSIGPMISAAASRNAYINEFTDSFNFQVIVFLPMGLSEMEASYIAHQAMSAGATDVAYEADIDAYIVTHIPGGEEYRYIRLRSLTNANLFEYFNLELVDGHKDLGPNEIAVFDEYAEKNNISVGDTLEVECNDTTYITVVGAIIRYHTFYERFGRDIDTVFASEVLARAMGLDERITGLLVKAPEEKVDDVCYSIMDALGPIIAVRKVSDLIEIPKRVYTIVFLYFSVLAALMFIIALVSVIVTVRQMGYELRGIAGMLRAIGTTERSTIGTFVIAAIVMTLTGLLPSIILAYPAALMERRTQTELGMSDLPFVFPAGRYTLIIVSILLLIAVSSYLAVRRLKKKTVIDLLRERCPPRALFFRSAPSLSRFFLPCPRPRSKP